ncbi:MAG TPA: hypothetical protein VFU13_13130 [Steroidobacteraceae bacterium]|nr:hypothetical protein [Steroidobacteraceae bacterium]
MNCCIPLLAALILLLGLTPDARAIDAIVLEVGELRVAGIAVEAASARLDLLSDQQTRLTVGARAATLPAPVGRLTQLSLVCTAPVIAEPRFACDAGRFTGTGGPTGTIDVAMTAEMRTDTGVTSFGGRGLKIAGTTATFDGRMDEKGWQVKGRTGTTSVDALRKFAAPWFSLPADITGDGKVAIEGSVADAGAGTVVDATLNLDAVTLTNEASTIVTDNLGARVGLRARLNDANTELELRAGGKQGQVLVNPVLLDLGKNPLALESRGKFAGDVMTIESLHFTQTDLIDLTGSGSVNLAGEMPSVSGDFRLAKLQFPAAYTSYLQISLATTRVLSDLSMGGSLSGEFSVRDNGITTLHISPKDLRMNERKDALHLLNVNGDVHWRPAGVPDAPASKLSWSGGGAYGLSGGAATVEFLAQGAGFQLTRPTKLPIFDGALAIDTLSLGNLDGENMEVAFRGNVEPISMPLLAKAFGWPEFSGTLAASVPGVTLRDNVLTFQGNVESQVFGGHIVGSNIRMQDPLGRFPQFFADVRARDLDLGLLTQTFEVGSITGKLEVDVLGLELFAWTPTAFDARLATPKGDKSRRRISAKAVSSLSNVGGGGGGVVQALQSGVLRFFDEYSYEKLGITCKLVGDVCEMSGIEPAGVGYYIVKGAGLPRIDIVGSQGRVNWNQLLSSISTAEFGGATVNP